MYLCTHLYKISKGSVPATSKCGYIGYFLLLQHCYIVCMYTSTSVTCARTLPGTHSVCLKISRFKDNTLHSFSIAHTTLTTCMAPCYELKRSCGVSHTVLVIAVGLILVHCAGTMYMQAVYPGLVHTHSLDCSIM